MKSSDRKFTRNVALDTLIREKTIHLLTINEWSNDMIGLCNLYTKLSALCDALVKSTRTLGVLLQSMEHDLR